MQQAPYRSAKRVFWVVDNGSSHRGKAAAKRLALAYTHLLWGPTPGHASWLPQVDLACAILHRQALTAQDWANLEAVAQRWRRSADLANQHPRPCHWKVDRAKWEKVLQRLAAKRAAHDQGPKGLMAQNQGETLAA